MKLIRPGNGATLRDTEGGSSYGRPQQLNWRKEWIENQPRYVELSCGHKTDLHDRALLIINSFKGTTVHCDDCDQFVTAIRPYRKEKPAIEQDPLPPF